MGCQYSHGTGKLCVLEKSQRTSRPDGGKEASLQITQMLNLALGKKVCVPF